jgi:hypothetical protein
MYRIQVSIRHADNSPIVCEENTGVSIDVGPWVLSLSGSEENVGNELVNLAHELEQRIVG